jgi:hypothetical protein
MTLKSGLWAPFEQLGTFVDSESRLPDDDHPRRYSAVPVATTEKLFFRLNYGYVLLVPFRWVGVSTFGRRSLPAPEFTDRRTHDEQDSRMFFPGRACRVLRSSRSHLAEAMVVSRSLICAAIEVITSTTLPISAEDSPSFAPSPSSSPPRRPPSRHVLHGVEHRRGVGAALHVVLVHLLGPVGRGTERLHPEDADEHGDERGDADRRQHLGRDRAITPPGSEGPGSGSVRLGRGRRAGRGRAGA